MKKAEIYMYDKPAGTLIEDEEGYRFHYHDDYIESNEAEAISLTFPLNQKSFYSPVLFPFFDGLIPEGWLLDIVEQTWKINARDRMSILLATCKDCIGAVSVIPVNDQN